MGRARERFAAARLFSFRFFASCDATDTSHDRVASRDDANFVDFRAREDKEDEEETAFLTLVDFSFSRLNSRYR